MRKRDLRTQRREKRAPWSQQPRDDRQAEMDAAFEQLDRERQQQAQPKESHV